MNNPSLILLPILLIVIGLVFILLAAAFVRRFLRRRLGSAALRAAAEQQNAGSDDGALPGPWRELRTDVEMSKRVLTLGVFEKARQIFLDFYSGEGPDAPSPAGLTSEWDHEEFLLVLDEHGSPSVPVKAMVERFAKTAAARPSFRRWFREVTIQEGEWEGVTTLAAARWLCHLVGLRHGTVEIFIDPPHLAGHTLVQVRGMEKFEAPGAFDIPCAGHISGVDSAEKALEKELLEELNLELVQLDELRLLGRYNSFPNGSDAGADERKNNHEHRVLYRARLKPDAAANIRFSDGEVAGLSVFALSELRALVRRYPERVAGGLSDAMGFYK